MARRPAGTLTRVCAGSGTRTGGVDFLVNLPIPGDPILQDAVINMQGLILGDAGDLFLSNGVNRVVGE